jgi:hypothetical protein
MSKNKLDALEFFIAGVPPRVIYGMDVEDLAKLVNSSQRRKNEYTGRTLVEVCLIGLASYFEAFCKNQFAAIINICPQTLNNFTLRRDNATIKLTHLIKIAGEIDYRLGALLAEEYDFGSARTINSLYFDLLGITPFSKDEEGQYSQFLNDRNLLVHHGGVYTIKYHGQRFQKNPVPGLAHWDSLVIDKADFRKWLAFLNGIVDKISVSSQKALKDFIKAERIRLKKVNTEALEFMGWKYKE